MTDEEKKEMNAVFNSFQKKLDMIHIELVGSDYSKSGLLNRVKELELWQATAMGKLDEIKLLKKITYITLIAFGVGFIVAGLIFGYLSLKEFTEFIKHIK
jgi:hypothetical protein